MPLVITIYSFRCDPSNICDYSYGDHFSPLHNKDTTTPKINENEEVGVANGVDYTFIVYWRIRYKRCDGYKTRTVNNIATIICSPFDLIGSVFITGANVLLVGVQVIFHSPAVLVYTCYNSLTSLDNYLSS